jgi:hypothetical protein
MKSEKFLTFVGKNRAGRGIARLIYKSFFHFLWCFLRLPSKVGSSTLLTRSISSAGHSAANSRSDVPVISIKDFFVPKYLTR